MNDTFVPFPVSEQFPGQIPNGPAQAEPKRRGPRRSANPNATVEVQQAPAKRMGRPKKVTETAAPPLALSSLFTVLAGLQSSDVVPLTSCYDTLAAMPPADRVRVLGFLNRVWG